jgi:type IV pilus assembly protein PilW
MNVAIQNNSGKQKGFTLVEIMVALTLSMVLIGGVIQIYISGKESYRVQKELARLQENQRIAMEFIQNDIRRAGFTPKNDPGVKPIPFDQRISVTDGGNASDSITITYTSDTDCLGAATGGTATNRYFIQNNQLMCAGNGGGAPMPIADGVENMQILLGENTNFANDTPQLYTADRYVNRTDLNSTINVVSVRVAILVRTSQPIRTQSIAQTFNLLDMNIAQNDRVKRQVSTTTIAIRNNV